MSKTGKTREEVEELKVAWMNDAIWDIEDTEGFEEYREELLAFRKEKEAEWHARYQAELGVYAREIGVAGKLELAEFYRQSMRHRNDLMDDARDYLKHYLGRVVGGDGPNQSDCMAEIGGIVDFIVAAAEASCFAHVALELTKAQEAAS